MLMMLVLGVGLAQAQIDQPEQGKTSMRSKKNVPPTKYVSI